ncbi:MAG: hypothetical protein JKY93_10930 [Gammaproteobacteria bacterium]|nr:hypothetical protein [Gammaproteobacteria bacterium]
MNKLLEIVFNIMLMRQLPQDLPYSQDLLKWLLVLYGVSGVIALQMAFTPSIALLQTLFDVCFLVVILWSALHLLKREARFVQVLTALMAIGVVFQLISIPFMYALYHEDKSSTFYTLSVFALFACLVWNLSLVAYILRHALEIKQIQAVAATLLYYISLTVIANSLFDFGLPAA